MDTVVYISSNKISQTEPVAFIFDGFLWKWKGLDDEFQRYSVLCTHPDVPYNVLYRYILPEGIDTEEKALELPEFTGSEPYTEQQLGAIPPKAIWVKPWWQAGGNWNPINWAKWFI